ncbi:MAG TPA: tetratricopeptide repeat protein [Candidatus Sulfotelmatobacter sp.]
MALAPGSLFTRRRARTGAVLRVLAWTAIVAAGLHAFAQDQFKTLVQRAFEMHQQGQFAAALPLLHRAYGLRPEDYFVNLLLGIDSLRTGDAKGSISFLRKASRLRPKEEYPQAYLGEAYARQTLFAEAASAYLKAVEVAPGSSESSVAFVDFALARFGEISALLRSSNRGLAAEYRLRALPLKTDDISRVSLLQRAADLDPSAPGIWSDLARAAVETGDTHGAAEDCRRALELNPHDLVAWIVDAQLAARNADWKRVNERLNAVAQRSPHILSEEVETWPRQLQPAENGLSGAAAKFFTCLRDRQALCQFGMASAASAGLGTLFEEQRWEQITKLPAPGVAEKEAWLRRGIAFAKLDDCERAIPALERGATGSSPDFHGLFELSRCYSQQAGRAAQQVQQSAENEAALHIMRGDIFLRLQAKPELAISEYEQALHENGNDPSVLERLAEAQFGAGKADVARATAESALKIDPQRMGAKRTLARIAMQARDYSRALPYLRDLAARNPADVSGQVELAKACAQTGALDEAWQNLAPALQHGYPDEKGTLHYLLGTVLKKMGRTTEAEQAFAQATQLSDDFQHKSYRDQDDQR